MHIFSSLTDSANRVPAAPRSKPMGGGVSAAQLEELNAQVLEKNLTIEGLEKVKKKVKMVFFLYFNGFFFLLFFPGAWLLLWQIARYRGTSARVRTARGLKRFLPKSTRSSVSNRGNNLTKKKIVISRKIPFFFLFFQEGFAVPEDDGDDLPPQPVEEY